MTASVELDKFELVPFAGQQPAQRLEHVGLIVGDQQARGFDRVGRRHPEIREQFVHVYV